MLLHYIFITFISSTLSLYIKKATSNIGYFIALNTERSCNLIMHPPHTTKSFRVSSLQGYSMWLANSYSRSVKIWWNSDKTVTLSSDSLDRNEIRLQVYGSLISIYDEPAIWTWYNCKTLWYPSVWVRCSIN